MKQPKMFYFRVLIVRPGGFMASGRVHSTYKEDISGAFEQISPLHYYNRNRGRDIYPSQEEVIALKQGQEVVIPMDRWK